MRDRDPGALRGLGRDLCASDSPRTLRSAGQSDILLPGGHSAVHIVSLVSNIEIGKVSEKNLNLQHQQLIFGEFFATS